MSYSLKLKAAALIRKVAGDFPLKRKLPDDLGGVRINCTLNTDIRFLLPSLEEAADDIFVWVRKLVRPGDVVWDLGANVGLFTFSSAALSGSQGRVLAVDASPEHCEMLLNSAKGLTPAHAKVEVLCAAVCESMGYRRFDIVERGHTKNHLEGLGHSTAGKVSVSCGVVGLTADWLLEQWSAPHVIKVDVEGAEFLFLQGASRLLSEARPKILIEISEHLSQPCSEILLQHGYRLYDAASDPGLTHPLQQCTFNTVAIPQ